MTKVSIQIPFESLVAAIASLDREAQRQLLSLLQEQISANEGNSNPSDVDVLDSYSPEVKTQIQVGREFVKQYCETFKALGK